MARAPARQGSHHRTLRRLDLLEARRLEDGVQLRELGVHELLELVHVSRQLAREDLVDVVRLLGRPAVARLHDAEERADAVVEANRIVEWILAAAILRLIN